jgi:hypothetical protein
MPFGVRTYILLIMFVKLMPYKLSFVKPNWFVVTTNLAALGFFQLKKKNLRIDKPFYNGNIAFHLRAYYSTNPIIFFYLLKKIYPLIAHIIINTGIFFFLSLGESGILLFKNFFPVLKKSKISIIFD